MERKDEQIALLRLVVVLAKLIALLINGRQELSISVTRCRNLEASRDEMKRRLDDFTDVLNINRADIHVTDQKVGSGGFASKTLKFEHIRNNKIVI